MKRSKDSEHSAFSSTSQDLESSQYTFTLLNSAALFQLRLEILLNEHSAREKESSPKLTVRKGSHFTIGPSDSFKMQMSCWRVCEAIVCVT